jgi:serine/threonine protein phosphatase PrpC
MTPSPPAPAPPFEFACATDTGLARNNNEDSVVFDETASLAVLADGMGGYNAGEVASSMATSLIRAELGSWLTQADEQVGDDDICGAMERHIGSANRAIFQAANSQPQCAGIGTTLVVAAFRGARLTVAHVGDSRAYRWRGGVLTQITRDHSLLQEQLDAGLITPAQAAVSNHRNLVTRAVGVEADVQVETHAYPILPGDCVLLCSDGLSDMIPDERIAAVLAAHESLKAAAQALIQAANKAGGRDNISVILVRSEGATQAARAWWPFKR